MLVAIPLSIRNRRQPLWPGDKHRGHGMALPSGCRRVRGSRARCRGAAPGLPVVCQADDLLVLVLPRRASGGDRRIWVRRSKCVPCRTSHCLLPAFCLLGRLYSAEVIGPAVAAIVDGALTREVADAVDFPYTTVRDWRRRHRDRSSVLAAGFAALAVELGAGAPPLASVPEQAALEALGAAWAATRDRYRAAVAGLWRFWSVVSGGVALSTTTDTPWTSVGGRRLIPPVP